MIRIYLVLLLFSFHQVLPALSPLTHAPFIENKGQWEEDYSWYLKLRWGQLYFHHDRVVVDTWDQQQYHQMMEAAHTRSGDFSHLGALKKHAYEISFPGSSPNKYWSSSGPSEMSFNYYLGNNPEKWKSGLKGYQSIQCNGLWDGIDMNYKIQNGRLKYEFYVGPDADFSQIKIAYTGLDKMLLKKGNLYLSTSVGDIIEMAPVAWQIVGGKKILRKCRYKITGNQLSFLLDKDYDKSYPLVIDPEIIFSTYSGSTGDNWGSTATYDEMGNAYLGGINFKTGYPFTVGAYQTTFAGDVDVTITKFNPTGDKPIYSTYLGGTQTEIAYSMFVDPKGNLIITGSTGSSNFPITSSAFDKSFNGGSPAFFWQNTATTYLANFPNGSDLFVAKFSPDGSSLLASTFLGGSKNEGLNLYGGLNHNYGDTFRGEVISDNSGNIYVIATTMSDDLPIKNAWQINFGGGMQDACVFKLNSDLSNILFCSYFGGEKDDSGYGMAISSLGFLYFCGGSSSSIINGNKKLQQSNNGIVDGFVAKVNLAGGNIVDFSFLGSSQYDQCFFVQVDNDNDVLILGQTAGDYPIFSQPGQTLYSIPNGSLFFHKLNANLNQTIWSTRFGVPGTMNHLVPTAFLVDYCNYISFSIWGGIVNSPLYSTTNGLPITNDAFQKTTSGSDFYLGVLKDNASALHYGSFLGGAQAYEHVDGGTSRFDKNGIIYQAVCAGCGPVADDLPVTLGVWSTTNNSENCNAALFKFDLSEYSAIIEDLKPGALCVGKGIQFNSLSTGNPNLTWDFGDGTLISADNPIHEYKSPGTYKVKLVAKAQSTCVTSDTASIIVKIAKAPELTSNQLKPICKGDTVRLQVFGAEKFSWLAGQGIPNDQLQSSNPLVRPEKSTIYKVIGTDACGSDTASVPVDVSIFTVKISSPSSNFCKGDSIKISVGQAASYAWNPLPKLTNANGSAAVFLADADKKIKIEAKDSLGCPAYDSVLVKITVPPIARAPNDTNICKGDSIFLKGLNGLADKWYAGNKLIGIGNAFAKPSSDVIVKVESGNQCGTTYDSLKIHVSEVNAEIGPNKVVCALEPVKVFAKGGKYYEWQPAQDFLSPDSANTVLYPKPDRIYKVTVIDEFGCSDVETLPVKALKTDPLDAGPDQFIAFGEKTYLSGLAGKGKAKWFSEGWIECDSCLQTKTYTEKSAVYVLKYVDLNGCEFEDSLKIDVEGAIYLPNSFSPNGDDINDIFGAASIDLINYQLEIFNRWGERIFDTKEAKKGWDGTTHGLKASSDIYSYKLTYTINSGRRGSRMGWVMLL